MEVVFKRWHFPSDFGTKGGEALGTHIGVIMNLSYQVQLFQHPSLPRIPLIDKASNASYRKTMQGIAGALMLRVRVQGKKYIFLM